MKQFKVFLIFLVLSLLSTGVSQADILFNNFGPGDTYNTTLALRVAGGTSGAPSEQESAVGFMPNATAQIGSIDFVASLFRGTNEITLSLVNNNQGVPDTVSSTLESWTFTGQMGQFGTTAPILTADSILNPLLQAGTFYWLVMSPPVSDTWAEWNVNSIGDIGPVSFSFDGGSTWSVGQPASRGVFRVNSTAVPEPSTILLLGAGLAGVGLMGRRFKK